MNKYQAVTQEAADAYVYVLFNGEAIPLLNRRNAMDLGIEGIKCDAEGCDYEDMSIAWGTTPEEILAVNDEYLNKPCPKCGASLLTPEDHAVIKMMVETLPTITDLEDALIEELGEDHPMNQKVKADVKMDGSGKVAIEIKK